MSRSRTLVRKISDYISVLLLGPLLIVLSTAMITALSSHTVIQNLSEYRFFRGFFILFKMVIPYLGLWIAFTAIYILMPNTSVRLLPALIAGVICGTLWEMAFHLYTSFNIGMTRYNKIYGTFAARLLFIFLQSEPLALPRKRRVEERGQHLTDRLLDQPIWSSTPSARCPTPRMNKADFFTVNLSRYIVVFQLFTLSSNSVPPGMP